MSSWVHEFMRECEQERESVCVKGEGEKWRSGKGEKGKRVSESESVGVA